MNKRIFAVWLCGFGLNLFAMAANLAEHRSVYQIIDSIESLDGNINQLQLWEQLGIKSCLFDAHPRADVFSLGTETNQIKLLRLSDQWLSKWQYILFLRNTNGGWRFGGNIDLSDEHYEEPVHHLREIGGRTWLVLEHINDSSAESVGNFRFG